MKKSNAFSKETRVKIQKLRELTESLTFLNELYSNATGKYSRSLVWNRILQVQDSINNLGGIIEN